MKVKLVSITQPLVEEAPGMTAEDLIVYTARVSNPSNQLNLETADKLIAFLIKHEHWLPFEMVDMTAEIVTSRAIAAQILRHRSFSFQEFSQRYANVTAFEPIEIRRQAEKNRQSSEEVFDPSINVDCGSDIVPHNKASYAIDDHLQYSENLYKSLLAAGVAKEVARMVLPLTTQTRIYMKGSVRSWIHYLKLRLKPGTQLEHRNVAVEIAAIFENRFPNISKALQQNDK